MNPKIAIEGHRATEEYVPTTVLREQEFVLHGCHYHLQLIKYNAKSGELHRLFCVRVKHNGAPIFWEGTYDFEKADSMFDRQFRHYATRVATVALC